MQWLIKVRVIFIFYCNFIVIHIDREVFIDSFENHTDFEASSVSMAEFNDPTVFITDVAGAYVKITLDDTYTNTTSSSFIQKVDSDFNANVRLSLF